MNHGQRACKWGGCNGICMAPSWKCSRCGTMNQPCAPPPAPDSLTPDQRATVEAIRPEIEALLRDNPGLRERAASLHVEPGNKILALPRLLTILDEIAPPVRS